MYGKASCFILAFTGLSQAQSFDYVIVGGGTAGLLVANRLSEDPNASVAVIDPGQNVLNNYFVQDPANLISQVGTSIDWKYNTVALETANNRTISYPSGKALGGTSVINAMAYLRPHKSQIDAWEKLGNTGWNWDTLLPYYLEVESFTKPDQDEQSKGASFDVKFHGTNGSVHVGYYAGLYQNGNFSIYEKEWDSLGVQRNQDANSGSPEGLSSWPLTFDSGLNRRWDAATAFLQPVLTRPNLSLINGTVARILWNSASAATPEASGVEYVSAAGLKTAIMANKEVILSAGALRTPLILERSGVGNPNILNSLGIQTVVASNGVGENFIDQTNTPVAALAQGTSPTGSLVPFVVSTTASDVFGDDVAALASLTGQKISYWAQQVSQASNGSLSTSALQTIFQVQHDVIFKQNTTLGEHLVIPTASVFGNSITAVYPFSRGSVHLQSSDDLNTPLIDPRPFLVDFDLQVEVAMRRLAARFWSSDIMQRLFVSENANVTLATPPAQASDDAWRSAVLDTFTPAWHGLGSAAMMSRDLGGVVDPELRVYGTQNLRIVDASVIPTHLSGHPMATVYAIAQRAAEIIKKSY